MKAISINNIDRIEITKGSGSVRFGDGAQAGTIQLYTRDTTETTLEYSLGNYGHQSQSLTTGYSGENYIISASSALLIIFNALFACLGEGCLFQLTRDCIQRLVAI